MSHFETASRRVLDRVERLTCLLMALLMAVLVVGVNFQVAARFWLSYSTGEGQQIVQLLAWGQELVQYAFLWMVFLGVGVGVRRGLHLRIDLLEGVLSPAARRRLGVLIDATCMILAAVFVVAGAVIAWRTRLHVSPALGLSIGLVYLVFPLSGLSLLAFLLEAIVWGRPANETETQEASDAPGGAD
ncbi:MAG: TRAP transporter small permease subunit [Pirellulales bacterium]|nr:TRAP transporter small permease subunit [Pirellulales bacterium]